MATALLTSSQNVSLEAFGVALTLLDDGTLVELDGALVVSPAGELVLPDAESSLLEHPVRTSRPAARLPATNTTRFMTIPFVQSSGSCEGNSGIRRWRSERRRRERRRAASLRRQGAGPGRRRGSENSSPAVLPQPCAPQGKCFDLT
jgi:hypothetical protein